MFGLKKKKFEMSYEDMCDLSNCVTITLNHLENGDPNGITERLKDLQTRLWNEIDRIDGRK